MKNWLSEDLSTLIILNFPQIVNLMYFFYRTLNKVTRQTFSSRNKSE